MLTFDTLLAAREAIRSKKIKSQELVRQALDRIQQLDGQIKSCNSVYADRALDRAKQVDAGRITGELTGVPIIVKDNICTRFGTTTCSSKMLATFRSPYDATVIRKLEEGQKCIGYDIFCTNHEIGRMPKHLVRNSIELFGKEVIPAFR